MVCSYRRTGGAFGGAVGISEIVSDYYSAYFLSGSSSLRCAFIFTFFRSAVAGKLNKFNVRHNAFNKFNLLWITGNVKLFSKLIA